MNNNFSSLKNLALSREGKRNRISSYDKTGGNNDFIIIGPSQSQLIAKIEGSGCINHIWMTLAEIANTGTTNYLRKVVFLPKPNWHLAGNSGRIINKHKIFNRKMPLKIGGARLQS